MGDAVETTPVTLRPAAITDAETLWRWRNDIDTRRASWDGRTVALPDHVAWLRETLARPDRRLYVAMLGTAAVGTARLDVEGVAAEVSITVSPEWRGRGLAPRVLDALIRAAFGELGIERLVARIKCDNRPSRLAFARAGFEAVKEGAVVVMVRERGGRQSGTT